MPDASPHDALQASVEDLMSAARATGRGDTLVVALLRELTELLNQRQPRGGALSADQAAYLLESGAFTADELAETEAAVRRGEVAEAVRATRLEAVADSLSGDEVASRLGVDASTLGELESQGALYSFIAGGQRRFSLWQFTDDPERPVLPHLGIVVNAIPVDLHAASVRGFMLTAQQSLRINAVPTTPVKWLQRGRDPQIVVAQLNGLQQM